MRERRCSICRRPLPAPTSFWDSHRLEYSETECRHCQAAAPLATLERARKARFTAELRYGLRALMRRGYQVPW